MHYYVTDNRAACMPLNEIPTAGYAEFYEDLAERLADERYHICLLYTSDAADE